MSALNFDPADLASKPHIVPCSEWGAAPPKEQSALITPRFLIPHSMANANRVPETIYARELEIASQIARDTQHFHMTSDYLAPGGGADSGHQIMISSGGLLLEGRHGSASAILAGIPLPQGAQCYGHNQESAGWEHEGDHQHVMPTVPQLKASLTLTSWACFVYQRDSHEAIKGHRDFLPDICPGDAFYNWFPAYRDLVHQTVLLLRQRYHRGTDGIWRLG